jgi:MFS family permease
VNRLRAQPGYAAFFSGATLARLADEMFGVGVVLLILDRTGSAALAGLTVAAATLPSVVTGPLLGAWLDLTGRRKAAMIFDQLLAASALAAIVLLAGHGPDALLPLLALIMGTTWPLSFGGFTSLIPRLVPEELLAPANAVEASSLNLATICGPALAGAIAALAGPESAVLTEAVLTAAALLLIVRIPKLDAPERRRTELRPLLGIAAAGLRQLVAVPELRGVTATGMIGMAGIGLLSIAFPLWAADSLGAAESASGYLWAAFAIGSTAGALGLVGLQSRRNAPRTVFYGIAVFGLLMLSWPLAGSLAVALMLVAIAGVADGPALAATFSVRQQTVPHRLHGQVFTTAAGLKIGSFSIGAALAGPAVTGLGPEGALVACALVQLAAAAIGVGLSRLRAGAAAVPSAPRAAPAAPGLAPPPLGRAARLAPRSPGARDAAGEGAAVRTARD